MFKSISNPCVSHLQFCIYLTKGNHYINFASGKINNIQYNTVMKTNKEKVYDVLNAIETGASEPIAYINESNYKQHNLGVADGLAGFGAALAGLKDYPEAARVNTVRVFQDGNYVFAHTDYNFFGPKTGFDIFRFEDGLIVEHWDNLQETPKAANPSGRTMIDGTTEVKDLEKTEENKALVKNFVHDVLMGEHPENLTRYFNGNAYIQHNPAIADNLDGLGKALADMAAAGLKMVYTTNHKILGEGNFVLSVSEGEFCGRYVAFYDLFRVEDGFIAEHWDAIEDIPAREAWKNDNGKFGF